MPDPKPPAPTKGCPPDVNEYNALYGGSYAQKMLWRGFIPLAGGFMQQTVDAPPTCVERNATLQAGMANNIADFELTSSENVPDIWNSMRVMLASMQHMTGVVSEVQTTPLQFKLLYLFAGTTALMLLSVAVLLSL